MAQSLQNVFAMFTIMMASYLLMKRAPYPVEVVNNLVFRFFLPVTVFHSVTGLQHVPAGELLLMALAGLAAMIATYLVALQAARACGLKGPFRKTFLLGATYGNNAFLGLPVCYAFLGDRGTVLSLFFILTGYLFLYLVGIYIMTGRVTPADLLKNPLIMAMCAGLLCVALHLPIPSFLSHTFSLMNTATFPLSMVVVGGGLRLRFFIEAGKIVPVLCAAALKLTILPLAAWGIGLALGMDRDQLVVTILQCAMPTAVLVTIFSVKYEADPVFSNAIVSLTTLASMATIPILFLLLS